MSFPDIVPNQFSWTTLYFFSIPKRSSIRALGALATFSPGLNAFLSHDFEITFNSFLPVGVGQTFDAHVYGGVVPAGPSHRLLDYEYANAEEGGRGEQRRIEEGAKLNVC